MPNLVLKEDYKALLDLRETERAIKFIKDYFQDSLAAELNLQRISAPFFLQKGSGINDDLNGVEAKADFRVRDAGNMWAECLFSLAKWKRMVLADYGFSYGEGLYTDMNAIRPEECLDNLHSVYVDQWDWEKVINENERNLDYLKDVVRKIYKAIKATEQQVCQKYTQIEPCLPDEIVFIHSEDLLKMYPDVRPSERENRISKKYGAVFIIGIGGELANGTMHDNRAPDYDDWITETGNGKRGLNGDIFFWYPVLERGFEISSMGIRVDKASMLRQLEIRNVQERTEMEWHQRLLDGELPLSIGGGIGQSRLCMFLLKKLHIGEVHSSVWPKDMLKRCKEADVPIL